MFKTISKLAAGAALVVAVLVTGVDQTNAMHHDKNIVGVAEHVGGFSTLIAAIKAAGLEETLEGNGPFTVFAPTDEAFANLPAGTVENLLKPENKDQLVAILTYHVVPGKVLAADVVGNKLSPATVQGSTLSVDGTDGVKVNDANVVKADVLAKNGVIHVVDSVLLPK